MLNFHLIVINLGFPKAELSGLNNHVSKFSVTPIRIAQCYFKVERPMLNFRIPVWVNVWVNILVNILVNWVYANKTLNFSPILINLGFLKADLSGQTNNVSTFYLSPIRITQC